MHPKSEEMSVQSVVTRGRSDILCQDVPWNVSDISKKSRVSQRDSGFKRAVLTAVAVNRGVSAVSRAADGDIVDADARDARARIGAEIVADFGEAFPEVVMVSGDVHFGNGGGEFAIFDGDADDAVREVAADVVLVAAEETGDIDAVLDIGNHRVKPA